jgi:hypothetical protein
MCTCILLKLPNDTELLVSLADRSNGFEKKFFQLQADRKATASEAYAWSIEEM